MSKLRKEVEVIIDNVKRDIHAEVAAKIENINDHLKEVSNNCGSAKTTNCDDISLNVVIRNLPESTTESTVNKVNALIKNGFKVTGVVCDKAERKKNRDSTKPGVVIARFKSHKDKRKIMQQKSTLDNSQQYRDVFINHDVSLSERRMSDNFRTILGVLKKNDLVIRGSRVVKKGSRSDTSNNDRRESQTSRNEGDSYNDMRGNNQFSDRQGGNGLDRPSDSSSQENSGWQRYGKGNNRGRYRGGRGNNRAQR
ncbi:hypothetical protein DPMN_162999 [Dreissena polymorpha]|uniref:Uncharacterized protein n=1 Tax=Dreissena polymorpha TaxID=45954 RepID=A0A9D4IU69_DREPO|nr:hypothetical protein DPMN_162999 [Dreissena polymorpha]